MSKIKSIEEIKSLYKNPLFSNKYYAEISGMNDIGYFIKSVTLPSNSYNCKNWYVGGVDIPVVNKFEQGQLDMQIYNTGKEYASIYQWGEKHYNQQTKSYGYVDDIAKSVVIYELNIAGEIVMTHTFTKCIMYQYGGIQLSYDEASQFEEFQVSLKFQTYSSSAASS